MKKTNKEYISQLKTTLSQSFSILIAREFFLKIIAFGAQFVLARLLLPKDFGFYAIIAFIVTFFGLFSDIGLSSAIIQKKQDPTREELSTILYIKSALAVFLIFCIFVSSPHIHIFYAYFQSSNIFMIRIFSLTIFTQAIRSVPVAIMERKMQYTRISLIDITGIISYYSTAIGLAYFHFEIWSFIIGVLISESIQTSIAYLYGEWIPGIIIAKKTIKEMLRFGIFIQGGGIVTFLNTAIIPVIAGIKSGPAAVGLLDWGTNIVSIPESVTNNFGRIAFSGFSKIQDDKKLLSKAMGKSIRILHLGTFLFAIIIFGFAREIVGALYTHNWMNGIPGLYWFVASTPFFAMISAYGQGILVLKQSKKVFFASLVSNICTWIVALIFIFAFDYTGVAAATFFGSLFLLSLYIYIGKKIGISIHLFKNILTQCTLSLVTLGCAYMLNIVLPHTLLILGVKLLVTVGVYSALSFFALHDEIVEIFLLLKTAVRQPKNLEEEK